MIIDRMLFLPGYQHEKAVRISHCTALLDHRRLFESSTTHSDLLSLVAVCTCCTIFWYALTSKAQFPNGVILATKKGHSGKTLVSKSFTFQNK